MQTINFYEEKIFSKWIIGTSVPVTVGFLFVLIYQILVEPIDTRPVPNCFFLLMFLLFAGVAINFSRLVIRMTSQSISVGYGILKHTILWENIEDCFLDKIRYRCRGIRIGGARIVRVKGTWRLVYHVAWGPRTRIVVSLKKGRFKEFVFSTKNTEEVIKIIKERIGRIK